MSPPIRDGSGSSIGSIRLGDGTEIAEVRTGAGDVLFSGNAIPDSVVDNFEEAIYEDKNNTLSDYYTSRGTWNRTQSNVQENSYAVEITSRLGFSDNIYSQEGDGLPRYPAEGERVGFLLNYGISHAGIVTNVESGTSPNGYGFSLSNGQIVITDTNVSDGDDNALASKNTSIPQGSWYWCEADPPTSSDNSIDFEVYELNAGLTRGSLLDSLSTTDSSYVGERGVGVVVRDDSLTGVVADWIRIL